jgi:hypothetical protein
MPHEAAKERAKRGRLFCSFSLLVHLYNKACTILVGILVDDVVFFGEKIWHHGSKTQKSQG